MKKKTIFLIAALVIIAAAIAFIIYFKNASASFAGLTEETSVSAQSMRMEATDFIQLYQNNDYLLFAFPKPTSFYTVNLYALNASGITAFPLATTFGGVHTVTASSSKPFYITASKLEKENIEGFIEDLEEAPYNFTDFETAPQNYYVNFKINDVYKIGTKRYLSITVTATKKAGNVESLSTKIRTNPCPPCTNSTF